jgi:hypothetical protein
MSQSLPLPSTATPACAVFSAVCYLQHMFCLYNSFIVTFNTAITDCCPSCSTRFQFRPMHMAWLTVGMTPLLLIPNYKLQTDGMLCCALVMYFSTMSTPIPSLLLAFTTLCQLFHPLAPLSLSVNYVLPRFHPPWHDSFLMSSAITGLYICSLPPCPLGWTPPPRGRCHVHTCAITTLVGLFAVKYL